MNLPIQRIPGVPDELIEQINDRFRRVGTGFGTGGSTQVVKGKDGKPGATGPAGTPGTGSVTPQAPDLVAATAAPVFSMVSNVTAFTFGGDITVDDTAPNWAQTAYIDVTAYGPTAPDGHQIAWLVAPFTVVSHKITWQGEEGAFLQPTDADETWSVVFTAYDTKTIPSPAPITVSGITVGVASVASITADELTPRFQDLNQGILTRAEATISLTNDQVPQNVTFWLSRDDGATWLLQGWNKVTTSPATITLPYPETNLPGFYVPSDGDETWKVAAASGPRTDASPPAEAVISSGFTVPEIGPPNPHGVTSATSDPAVTFIDGLGVPDWEIPVVSWTDPLVKPADSGAANYDVNCWYTVLTFQCTDSAGNPAPGTGSGNDQGGDEVEVARFPVLGGAVQNVTTINSYGFNPPGSIYHYACLRVYSVNRLGTSWKDTVSGNSKLQTTCWSGGDKLLVDFGSFPGASLTPAGFAPNLTSVSTPTVNYVTEGGLPKWNLNGTVTLPNPYTAIKKIHITIAGLPQILEIPAALFGSAQFPLAGLVMSYQTPNFPRDTVTNNYTVQFWVENSDGILTASPPSASITVTGTAAPFNASAPAAPTIATASASLIWTPYGHTFSFGFHSSVTAPATGAYSIRVSKIPPGAFAGVTIDTLPGPFTSGQVISWDSDYSDLCPSSTQIWTIRFLPINADNVASAAKDVLVTISPNVITAMSGSEDTSRRFIEPGGGSKTWVNIVPTITTTNGPGFSAGPQVLTCFLSFDGGSTWQCQGWLDATGSGVNLPVEVWRPTVGDQTCKTAAVIGAFDFTPAYIPTASLPAGTVIQSGTFTLSRVGVPLTTDCTGGFVNARTATSKNYNDITIMTTGDGVQTFGLPDGLGWINPPWSTGQNTNLSPTFDPNFWYAVLTAQCVDASGNPAPADQGGIEEQVQQFTDPGTVTCYLVQYWEFNPTGSIYTRMRFRVRVVSRSATNGYKDSTYSTIQNCWPGGAAFKDVVFGDMPISTVLATPTPAPTAAALTSAVVGYQLIQENGEAWFQLASSAFGLPTSSSDKANLLSVRLYIPLLQASGYVFDFARPSTGWPSSISFTAGGWPQPLVATNYPWEFRCVNADGVERPSLTGTLSVPAAYSRNAPSPTSLPVTSVTISETFPRTRQPDFTTQCTIHGVITRPSDVGVQNYTVYYSDDGGNNFLWTNWYPVSGTSGSFDLYKVAPVASKSIRLAVVAGEITGDPNVFLPLANLPGGPSARTMSNILTLTAVSTSGANVISSASLGSVLPTTDPNGAQDWYLQDIVVTDANPITDPYAKFSRLKVFICNSLGTRASASDGGLDQVVAEWDVDGTVHHCQTVRGWGYPVAAGFDRARFFIEVVNAAGVATVQNCWGGAAFADAVFGATPAGAMPATRMDPNTWGPGIIPNPTTGKPSGANPNPGTSLLNDWDFLLGGASISAAWGVFGATLVGSGGPNNAKYVNISGVNSFIQQSFACAGSQPLYFQVATRLNSGSMTMTADFYTSGQSFINRYTVGTVVTPGGWVITGISGTIPAVNVPSNASFCRYSLITNSGSCDVAFCIARQVVQQTSNGQTDTMAGSNGGLTSSSITTSSQGFYGQNSANLTASDGSQVFMQPGSGAPVIAIKGPPGQTNQITLQATSGGPNIQVVVGGIAFNGFNGTIQDNFGVNHTVKCGLIVN